MVVAEAPSLDVTKIGLTPEPPYAHRTPYAPANMDYVVDDVVRRVAATRAYSSGRGNGNSEVTAYGGGSSGAGGVSAGGIPEVVEAVLRIGGSKMGPALVRCGGRGDRCCRFCPAVFLFFLVFFLGYAPVFLDSRVLCSCFLLCPTWGNSCSLFHIMMWSRRGTSPEPRFGRFTYYILFSYFPTSYFPMFSLCSCPIWSAVPVLHVWGAGEGPRRSDSSRGGRLRLGPPADSPKPASAPCCCVVRYFAALAAATAIIVTR